MGVSCTVNLVDAEPTEEQIALFVSMLRCLRDNSSEFMIFEFMNAKNRPGEQQGLVFFQICREEERIHAEIRVDGAEKWRMYAADLKEDDAAALLQELIASRAVPDLAGWEDITETIVTDDSEFE